MALILQTRSVTKGGYELSASNATTCRLASLRNVVVRIIGGNLMEYLVAH